MASLVNWFTIQVPPANKRRLWIFFITNSSFNRFWRCPNLKTVLKRGQNAYKIPLVQWMHEIFFGSSVRKWLILHFSTCTFYGWTVVKFIRLLLNYVMYVLYMSSTKHTACDRPSSKNSDRKSTRLNSSHLVISYAVFCLKKKITKFIHLLSPVHSSISIF